ncbi:MAG: response regulator transcription factor, partial [Actinomycetes bacterium]
MDDLGIAVVIEDDADVRNLLEGVLTQAGFDVHTAVDGRTGVDVVRSQQASVVTLDIGLPDIDGFEVLRRIRTFSNAYVVMLTGRTEEPDLLSALNTGADDYIAKPFRPRELRARVAAMMRRPRHEATGQKPSAPSWGQAAAAQPEPGVLHHNGLLLNHRTRTVEVKGEPLGLTRSEFDLLHVLLKGGGAVCTRADLVRAVRGEYYDRETYISEADERAVEVHVGNLRRIRTFSNAYVVMLTGRTEEPDLLSAL